LADFVAGLVQDGPVALSILLAADADVSAREVLLEGALKIAIGRRAALRDRELLANLVDLRLLVVLLGLLELRLELPGLAVELDGLLLVALDHEENRLVFF